VRVRRSGDLTARHCSSPAQCFPAPADEDANKRIAAERKAQKYKARVYEKFPVRNWDKWVEDTQGHLFVQSLGPDAKVRDLLAGTKLISERGFAGRVQDRAKSLMPSGHRMATRSFLLPLQTETERLTQLPTRRCSRFRSAVASRYS